MSCQPLNTIRYLLLFSLIIGVTSSVGCSRRRAFDRSSRSVIPPSPSVSSGDPAESGENQLNLEPAPMPGRSGNGSAYQSPRFSAPANRTIGGTSIDMRFPSRRSIRDRNSPSVPQSNGSRLAPRSESGNELALQLPNARTGQPTATAPTGSPATLSESTSAAGLTPRFTPTTEPNVAAGVTPTLDDIRKLADEGFKTVINLSPSEIVDPMEAAEVRHAGMNYVSLPVTPQTLNRDLLVRFNQLIAESDRPIFMHDSDGVRTGAMWYLNRLIDAKESPDTARRQAFKLGLRDSGKDELSTQFWLAISRLVNEPS